MELLKKILTVLINTAKAIPLKGWIGIGIIILILLIWQLGAVGSSTSYVQDFIKRQVVNEVTNHMADAMKVLDAENERLSKQLAALQSKIKKNEAEIAALKKEREEYERRVADVEERLKKVIVPSGSGAIANDFRTLGYKSTATRPRSR